MIPYLEFTVVFLLLSYAFETYLDLRQRKRLTDKQRPKEIASLVTEEKFLKSQAYGRDKADFHLILHAFQQIEIMVFLFLGIFPSVWAHAGQILVNQEIEDTAEQIYQSLIFLGILQVWEIVSSLPFELYSTFVIEEKHGFNKQTTFLFIKDKVIALVLTVVIGSPVISVLLRIIHWGGEHFYIYVWAFLFTFAMVMQTVYPVLIAPLFNKYEPLPEGELRTGIEDLAKRVEFPLYKLYQVDGSRRSSHSNAYFYGFYKFKRIVLFDTLINQLPNHKAVIAIVGHEIGHWKLNHTLKNLVLMQFQVFIMFFMYGQMMNDTDMYMSFGFTQEKPLIIGLLLFFSHLMSPVSHVLGFLLNILSRHYEYQADEFAVDLGFGPELKEGLIKIHSENLSNLNPDSWYSTYHYSHPTLIERMRAIDKAVVSRKKKE
eukprot:GFYU01000715.1.p2 GENE.GFYU01000715.1~~GFYU01000715.1.p2  ORF type:complete len:430 (+),score=118.71 GFYU01000715.1:105-1394(+)